MMAWFIYVDEKQYVPFYVFLTKNNKVGNILPVKRFMRNGKYAVFFIGNFSIDFAEKIEEEKLAKCLIMGPSELWRKALQ